MYGDYTKRDLGCFGRLLERILSYSFPEIIYQAPADFESWWVDVFFRHKNKKYAVQIKHNDDGGMTKARKKMWKNHSEMFEMSLNFSRCKFTPDGYLGVRFLPEFLPTGKTGPNDTPPAELQTPQKLVKHLPSYLAWEMNVLNTFIEQLPPILDVIGAEKSGVLPNIVIEEGNGATKYKVTNNEGKTMVVVYHFHMF